MCDRSAEWTAAAIHDAVLPQEAQNIRARRFPLPRADSAAVPLPLRLRM
jgi:hypothetical protein